jgi:hypothetical protein
MASGLTGLFSAVVGNKDKDKDREKDREREKEKERERERERERVERERDAEREREREGGARRDSDGDFLAPLAPVHIVREAVQRSFKTEYYVCGIAPFGRDLALLR